MNTIFNTDYTPSLRVSYKWANKFISCDIEACHGSCCTAKSYYPPKANNGVCFYLSSTGCVLKEYEKPIICLLYPLIINKNNLLVLHGKALLGTCKLCYKKKEIPILQYLKSNLVSVFGEGLYNAMYQTCVIEKRNFVFNPSRNFWKDLEYEVLCEKENKIIKRPYFSESLDV